jgi:hypothetical protein
MAAKVTPSIPGAPSFFRQSDCNRVKPEGRLFPKTGTHFRDHALAPVARSLLRPRFGAGPAWGLERPSGLLRRSQGNTDAERRRTGTLGAELFCPRQELGGSGPGRDISIDGCGTRMIGADGGHLLTMHFYHDFHGWLSGYERMA